MMNNSDPWLEELPALNLGGWLAIGFRPALGLALSLSLSLCVCGYALSLPKEKKPLYIRPEALALAAKLVKTRASTLYFIFLDP